MDGISRATRTWPRDLWTTHDVVFRVWGFYEAVGWQRIDRAATKYRPRPTTATTAATGLDFWESPNQTPKKRQTEIKQINVIPQPEHADKSCPTIPFLNPQSRIKLSRPSNQLTADPLYNLIPSGTPHDGGVAVPDVALAGGMLILYLNKLLGSHFALSSASFW